jgi:ABC-type bacteriocin/lantibiotic exporter with double-glycine peptidase domain
MKAKRRFLAPEVVQTSEMDCGPAALRCLLEGFRIPVSYDDVREACQTDVDGSSIDTMEAVLARFALRAELVMLPRDQLFLPEPCTLPAILVVQLPSGISHSVVVWRRHGPYLQVMDPAAGRQWLTYQRFLDLVYLHGPVRKSIWPDSNVGC